ncbi:MAG: hypothetical protein KDJ65_01605 [Anaerolineae bacterium]|nr:hypothetical protein [Anaerolineae bacterium]
MQYSWESDSKYKLTPDGSSVFDLSGRSEEEWFGCKSLTKVPDYMKPFGIRFDRGYTKSTNGEICVIGIWPSPIEQRHIVEVVTENYNPRAGSSPEPLGDMLVVFGYHTGKNHDHLINDLNYSAWKGNQPGAIRGEVLPTNLAGEASVTVGGDGGHDIHPLWIVENTLVLPSIIVRNCMMLEGILNNHTCVKIRFQVRRAWITPRHIREQDNKAILDDLQLKVHRLSHPGLHGKKIND